MAPSAGLNPIESRGSRGLSPKYDDADGARTAAVVSSDCILPAPNSLWPACEATAVTPWPEPLVAAPVPAEDEDDDAERNVAIRGAMSVALPTALPVPPRTP